MQHGSIFRETASHARAIPRPKQRITCCRAATTKPCAQKNKTLWLILNDCLPDNSTGCQVHVFNSSVKQPAWASVLCLVEWGSTLCRQYLFLYIAYTQCAVAGRYTHWMICPLVCGQKKNWQNKNSGRSASGLCDASVWGGWKHPCTHLTWSVWILKMKGAHYGIFQCPFHCDRGLLLVKLPAVRPTYCLTYF